MIVCSLGCGSLGDVVGITWCCWQCGCYGGGTCCVFGVSWLCWIQQMGIGGRYGRWSLGSIVCRRDGCCFDGLILGEGWGHLCWQVLVVDHWHVEDSQGWGMLEEWVCHWRTREGGKGGLGCDVSTITSDGDFWDFVIANCIAYRFHAEIDVI